MVIIIIIIIIIGYSLRYANASGGISLADIGPGAARFHSSSHGDFLDLLHQSSHVLLDPVTVFADSRAREVPGSNETTIVSKSVDHTLSN